MSHFSSSYDDHCWLTSHSSYYSFFVYLLLPVVVVVVVVVCLLLLLLHGVPVMMNPVLYKREENFCEAAKVRAPPESFIFFYEVAQFPERVNYSLKLESVIHTDKLLGKDKYGTSSKYSTVTLQ